MRQVRTLAPVKATTTNTNLQGYYILKFKVKNLTIACNKRSVKSNLCKRDCVDEDMVKKALQEAQG